MASQYPQFYSFTWSDGTIQHQETDTNEIDEFYDMIRDHGLELDMAEEQERSERRIVSVETKFRFYD